MFAGQPAEGVAAIRPGVAQDEAHADVAQAEAARADVAEASWRLLALRQRSTEELRRALLRKGLPNAAVEAQLLHLQEQGYLDDSAFARSWVAMRQRSATPRGAAVLRAELRQKGIDPVILRLATDTGDEASAAYRAGSKRAVALKMLPHPEFRRRLFGFLARRGFEQDAVSAAVDAVWQDLHGAGTDEDTSRDGLRNSE